MERHSAMGSDEWLQRVVRLRVDRSTSDPAPHKPLLLLVVLDLAEEGVLPRDALPLTPELAFRFATYWSIVAERRTQRPVVRYPFHHLQSDGFWVAHDSSGAESRHRKDTCVVHLVDEFVKCAHDAAWRDSARRLLISTYFRAGERAALYGMLDMPVPTDDEITRDLDLATIEQDKGKGRSARFRLQVVSAYQYTCALTGHRLMTIDAASLVEAAHIHRFSDSSNNDSRNGLALTRNAHWAFDEGLWTLSDDYHVLVAANHFDEDDPRGSGLRHYHGQPIRLPSKRELWPDPDSIQWHRSHVYCGS